MGLNAADLELLRQERRRRQGVLDCLFEQQRAAVQDTARNKAYETTRRAGKTFAVLSDFIDHGSKHPHHEMAYIALTRPSAEQIAWPILKQLNRKHHLDAVFQEAKLRVRFPNESQITLYGADRPGWMTRLYGQKLAKVAIDESSFFTTDLNALVDDILKPCLSDLRGQIIMCSIPGYVQRGMFWDVVSGKRSGWSVHRWTAFDNPHMKEEFEADIAEQKAANPEIESTNSFKRNYRGHWCADSVDMVYIYQPERDNIEVYKTQAGDRFVLGIDLGWHDKTAFSVICYSPDRKEVIELESFAKPEMLLDEVARYIQMYQDTYPGIALVGDPSRRQAFEELRKRYNLPIIPAERIDKETWIELVNSDLAQGRARFVAPQCEEHLKEMQLLTWRFRPTGKRIEDPTVNNDASDAYLMAYRWSYHYRGEVPTPGPKAGTRLFWQLEESRMEEALLEQYGDSTLEDSWEA